MPRAMTMYIIGRRHIFLPRGKRKQSGFDKMNAALVFLDDWQSASQGPKPPKSAFDPRILNSRPQPNASRNLQSTKVHCNLHALTAAITDASVLAAPAATKPKWKGSCFDQGLKYHSDDVL